MTLFILFVSIIAILFLVLNLLFAPHNPYAEKFSSFECGFHSFLGQNRSQFNVKFFIFGLVFLLFDLEITLVFPFAVSQSLNSLYGLIIVLIFLVIVTIGFVYELGKGALKIDSKQNIGGLRDNTTNTSISFVEKVRGTDNSNTLYYGGGFIKNVHPSAFSSGNVGRAKRLYSTSNKSRNNSLINNSNVEAQVPNNITSSISLGNKVYLFLMRIVITMVGVILAKSVFWTWYNDGYSWPDLKDNIFSLYSGLIGVGCLVGGLITKVLDFTCFNIKIKDLLVDSTLKNNFQKLWKILLNLKSTFFDSKLPLVIAEVPGIKSKIKPQNFDFNLYQESNSGNRKEPSSGNSDLDNVGRNSIRRSKEEALASVANAKKFWQPKPWETPKQYEARVRDNDNKRWARSDKTKPILDYTEAPQKRDPKVIWNNIEILKEEFPQLPGETTDKWMRRLGNRERYRARILKMNPNYRFKSNLDPAVPHLIKDDIRHNNPWDPKVESHDTYMARTYNKARWIYQTGNTNYEKNLSSSPRSGKPKRS